MLGKLTLSGATTSSATAGFETGSNLGLDTTQGDFACNGVIANGYTGGTLGLTIFGYTSTVTLSASNSYTGATTISAGTLSLTGTLNGTSITTNNYGVFTEAASGGIVGGGGFTQGSDGTSTLSGSNTYTGATAVNGGSLTVNTPLGNTAVTVGGSAVNGGTLNLNGTNAISHNTLTVNNAYGIVNESSNDAISGTAALTISNGTVTLSNSNNYTGNTTLSGAGTLYLNAAGAISAGTLIYNGGNLSEYVNNALSGAAGLTLNIPLTLSVNNATTGALTLNGVTLTESGVTETFGSLALGNNAAAPYNPASTLSIDSYSTLNIAGATVNRVAGTTLDIGSSGAINVNSALVASGIYVSATSNGVAFATANGQTEWATNTGGVLGGLVTGGTTYGATANVDVGANDTAAAGAGANTLRFTGADSVTFTGSNTIATGGILVTTTGVGTITSGTIAPGGGKELLVIDNGSLAIASGIANNSGGASSFNLVGSGTATLSGSDSFTGAVNIATGATLQLGTGAGGSAVGSLGSGAGAVTNNGTLIFDRSNAYAVSNTFGGTAIGKLHIQRKRRRHLFQQPLHGQCPGL